MYRLSGNNNTGSQAQDNRESKTDYHTGSQATNQETSFDENEEGFTNSSNQDTISEVDDSHTKSDPEESIYEDGQPSRNYYPIIYRPSEAVSNSSTYYSVNFEKLYDYH